MPVPAGTWAPDAAVLASLGLAGRTVIAAVLARYELTLLEGLVLIEVAHAADALATLRAAARRRTLDVDHVRRYGT
jgi:hypothetical protein